MERRANEMVEPEDVEFRLTTAQGHQIVRCGNYAYAWPGEEPLKVGDRVLLPANWLVNYPSERSVTAFGSSYGGHLSHILRKVEI